MNWNLLVRCAIFFHFYEFGKANECREVNSPSVTELTCPDNYTEGSIPPTIRLECVEFHTNDTAKKSPNQTCGILSYDLPITFKKIVFSCTASYPTVWKFEIPPHADDKLKDFAVTKRRGVDKANFSNPSSYIFKSNLTLNFKDSESVPKIFCSGRKPKQENLIGVITSYGVPGDAFGINVQVTRKIDGTPAYNDTRLGANIHCNVTMSFDTHNRRFHCGNNSRPQIIYCSNPDECNSIFVLDDHTYDTIPNRRPCNKSDTSTTVYSTCSDEKKCSNLSVSNSPGVLICRHDQSQNSIARRYLVYQLEEGSPIREGRDNSDYENKTIQLSCGDENQIYFNQNITFTCKATGAYYTYGFVWGVSINGSQRILEKGEERFNENLQIYEVTQTINFTKAMGSSVTVLCHGPRWNFVTWVNSSKNIKVKESRKPEIIDEIERQDYTNQSTGSFDLVCTAVGLPVPEIRWTWGAREPLEKSAVEGHYSINTIRNDTHVQSIITVHLQEQEKARFLCDATNYFGHAEKYSSEYNSSSADWNWPLILGGLMALLAILVLVVVVVFYKKLKNERRKLSKEEIEEFENGVVAVGKSDEKLSEDALKLPYDKRYEYPKSQFHVESGQILGAGAFGVVYKGSLGACGTCAIKMSNSKSLSVTTLRSLLSEIKIMIYVGTHPNVVSILGACTVDVSAGTVWIATELCEGGSLQNFLRTQSKKQTDFSGSNMFENNAGVFYANYPTVASQDSTSASPEVEEVIPFSKLLRWCIEIADGMSHIQSKKVIHSDLASRNVLLSSDGKAKITDFGLSRNMYEYANYVKKNQEPLPWRWLAIESLQQMTFSHKSDVWSYGITLYEIFSLGDVPYPGLSWSLEFVEELKKGLRLRKPRLASDSIYEKMIECWHIQPEKRPDFSELGSFFNDMSDV